MLSIVMKLDNFYRVGHIRNKQGLWYSPDGEFTGLIHGKLDFCANNSMQMPFDPLIVGYLSATKTFDELLIWFPEADLQRLQGHGFYAMRYESTDYREHANHWIVNAETSVFKEIIYVNQLATL